MEHVLSDSDSIFFFFIFKMFFSFFFILTIQKSFPLFKIEKSINNNSVLYEIIVNDKTKKVELIHPIWLLDNSYEKTEELTLIETNLAYGITIHQKNDNNIQFSLKSYPSIKISAELINGKWSATFVDDDQKHVIDKIYVNMKRVFGIPKVSTVSLYSTNLKTKEQKIKLLKE